MYLIIRIIFCDIYIDEHNYLDLHKKYRLDITDLVYHCATMNYVFINLVEDKQTRVMHVTDWRYVKGKLFQAINLLSLKRMCLLPEKLCDQNFVFPIWNRFKLRWKKRGATKNAFLYSCYRFILWSQDRVLNYEKLGPT